ncbi:MAG: acyltransferase [Bacteroidia bacterium]|nr:acyltransferase [Bacteroidia bacterium]
MNKTVNEKVFFPKRDGLRYIAFAVVFIQHAFSIPLEPFFPKPYVLNKLTNAFFWAGGYGVSCFFVLSGFLITYLLLLEKQRTGKIDVPAFYMRRTLRIWPLYFALILFTFFVYAPQHGTTFPQLTPEKWKYFYFLTNMAYLVPGGGIHPAGISWSVAIEEQFYLIWPLLFLAVPFRWSKWIFPLVMLLSLGFRIQHHANYNVLYYHTFANFYDLSLGGLTAWLAFNKSAFRSFFETRTLARRIMLYTTGILLIIFGKSIQPDEWYLIIQRVLSTAFFAFIIMDQCYSSSSVMKFSGNAFLSKWGKYTYGMYMLHPLAIDYAHDWFGKFLFKDEIVLNTICVGVFALGFTHIICYVSFHYFETPFLKLKQRFSHIQTR